VGWALDPRAAAPLPATIGALLFFALVAAWPLPAAPASPRLPALREARGLLAAPSYALFLGVSLLAQTAHAGYDLCFSLHLRDRGASDARIGAAWAVGVVFEVVLMAFAAPICARFSPPALLLVALLGSSARWLLLATVGSVTVLCLLQPLHALSFALWWVASLEYIRRRAPAGALATAQGLFSAATALGSVVGMLAWGALYRRAGGAAVFGAAAAVALLGALSTALFRKTFAPSSRPGYP
jgi:PPP family 3-phenylpropionic acid transporter